MTKKDELKERAAQFPDFDAKKMKKVVDIEKFLAEKGDAQMVQKCRLKELMERAATMEGFNKRTHGKNVAALEAFLAKMTVEAKAVEAKAVEAKAVEEKKEKKKSSKKELRERAEKYEQFRNTIHGKNIEALTQFLKEMGSVVAEEQQQQQKQERAWTREEVLAMKAVDLKKLAKKHGRKDRTGTKKELLEFLLPFYPAVAVEEDVVEVVAPVAAAAATVAQVKTEISDWPVSADILKKNEKSIEKLVALLKTYGIETGLPRKRSEIMELFKKRRCSPDNFSCSDAEFCDLRNQLCRDLSLLKKKDSDDMRKFANGMAYYDEAGKRFYGTEESLAIVREALVSPPPPPPSPPAVVIATPSPASSITTDVSSLPSPEPEKKKEDGISPININRLLDKSSEDDIRKTILNCLGLYHDIVNPNDEIIQRS